MALLALATDMFPRLRIPCAMVEIHPAQKYRVDLRDGVCLLINIAELTNCPCQKSSEFMRASCGSNFVKTASCKDLGSTFFVGFIGDKGW